MNQLTTYIVHSSAFSLTSTGFILLTVISSVETSNNSDFLRALAKSFTSDVKALIRLKFRKTDRGTPKKDNCKYLNRLSKQKNYEYNQKVTYCLFATLVTGNDL